METLLGVCDSGRRAGAVPGGARSVLPGATNPVDHTYTLAAAGGQVAGTGESSEGANAVTLTGFHGPARARALLRRHRSCDQLRLRL